jgi:hypothetical protein
MQDEPPQAPLWSRKRPRLPRSERDAARVDALLGGEAPLARALDWCKEQRAWGRALRKVRVGPGARLKLRR